MSFPERHPRLLWATCLAGLAAFALLQAASVQADPQTFSCTGKFEVYTAPYTGRYSLTVSGAQGGKVNATAWVGGKGAKVTGQVDLTEGDKLRIGVGCQGGPGIQYNSGPMSGGGGGGASSIVLIEDGTDLEPGSNDKLLLMAGGGGGAGRDESGEAGRYVGASSGTGGGIASDYYGGAGGGGYRDGGRSHNDDTGITLLAQGGQSYLAGHAGGGNPNGGDNASGGDGGWGGGGEGGPYKQAGTNKNGGGGGGGGFDGGDGTQNAQGGSGGGSYYASEVRFPGGGAGLQPGHGQVIIQPLGECACTSWTDDARAQQVYNLVWNYVYPFDDGDVTLSGTALSNTSVSPYLHLTENLNSQNGTIMLQPFAAGEQIQDLQVEFKMKMDAGADPPADGFSVNFGPPEAVKNPGYAGSSEGLAVAFDIYYNGSSDTGSSVSVRDSTQNQGEPFAGVSFDDSRRVLPAYPPAVDAQTRADLIFPANGDSNDHTVVVTIEAGATPADSTLSVVWDTTVILDRVPVTYDPAAAGDWAVSVSATTGGLSKEHYIKDITVSANGATDVTVNSDYGEHLLVPSASPATSSFALGETVTLFAPDYVYLDRYGKTLEGTEEDVRLRAAYRARLKAGSVNGVPALSGDEITIVGPTAINWQWEIEFLAEVNTGTESIDGLDAASVTDPQFTDTLGRQFRPRDYNFNSVVDAEILSTGEGLDLAYHPRGYVIENAPNPPERFMQLSGTGDYLYTDQSDQTAALDGSQSFTIEFWARVDPPGSQVMTRDIVALGSAVGDQLRVGFRSSRAFYVSAPGVEIAAEPALTDNTWHYWAVVYDADYVDASGTPAPSVILYRDGKALRPLSCGDDAQCPSSTPVGALSFALDSVVTIGARDSGGDAANFFAGGVNNLRVWGSARSMGEIRADAVPATLGAGPLLEVPFDQLDYVTGTGSLPLNDPALEGAELNYAYIKVPVEDGSFDFEPKGFAALVPVDVTHAQLAAALHPGFHYNPTPDTSGDLQGIDSDEAGPLSSYRRVFWLWQKEFGFEVSVLTIGLPPELLSQLAQHAYLRTVEQEYFLPAGETGRQITDGILTVLEKWIPEGDPLEVGAVYRSPNRRYTLSEVSQQVDNFATVDLDTMGNDTFGGLVAKTFRHPAVTAPGKLVFHFDRTIFRARLPIGTGLDFSSVAGMNLQLDTALPDDAELQPVTDTNRPNVQLLSSGGPLSSTDGEGEAWQLDRVGKRLYFLKPGVFSIDWTDANTGETYTIQVTTDFPATETQYAFLEDPDGHYLGDAPNYVSDFIYPSTEVAFSGHPDAHYRYVLSPNDARPAPFDLDLSSDDGWHFLRRYYSDHSTAQTDTNAFTARFTETTAGTRSVLVFSRRTDGQPATGDLTREEIAVRVVRSDQPDLVERTEEIYVADRVPPCRTGLFVDRGTCLQSSADEAGLGTGWIINEVANYNATLYDSTALVGQWGPVFPVNDSTVYGNDSNALQVQWYRHCVDSDATENTFCPDSTIQYNTVSFPEYDAPVTPVIYIASQLGSEGFTQDYLNPPAPQRVDAEHQFFDPTVFTGLTVYNQPDRSLAGFNPNEEHALIAPSNYAGMTGDSMKNIGQSAVFALQKDINCDNAGITAGECSHYTSEPFVLAQFTNRETGEPDMIAYAVKTTRALGGDGDPDSTLDPPAALFPNRDPDTHLPVDAAGNPVAQPGEGLLTAAGAPTQPAYDFKTVTFAGDQVTPFYPLNLVTNGRLLTQNEGWNKPLDSQNTTPRTFWRDKNGVPWVVGGHFVTEEGDDPGPFEYRFWYPLAEGFWLGEGGATVSVGTPVKWLPRGLGSPAVPDDFISLDAGCYASVEKIKSYPAVDAFATFDVLEDGYYLLEATGAPGGGVAGKRGGYGATVTGVVELKNGELLRIGVGNAGEEGTACATSYHGGGGGGASSIVKMVNGDQDTPGSDDQLLLIAAGGGGAGLNGSGKDAGGIAFGQSSGGSGGTTASTGNNFHGGAGGGGYRGTGEGNNDAKTQPQGGRAYSDPDEPNSGGSSAADGGDGGWGGGGEGGTAGAGNSDNCTDPAPPADEPGSGGGGGGYTGGNGGEGLQNDDGGNAGDAGISYFAGVSGKYCSSRASSDPASVTIYRYDGAAAVAEAGFAGQSIAYSAYWRTDYPVLKRGETLSYAGGEYKAENPAAAGLPGVIGWASAEVVFDSTSPDMAFDVAAADDPAEVLDGYAARFMRLLDVHAKEYSKDQLPAGYEPKNTDKISVVGSRWYFKELAGSLAQRFYFDSLASQLVLRGRIDGRESGDPDLTAVPLGISTLEPNRLPEEGDDYNILVALDPDNTSWTDALDELVEKSNGSEQANGNEAGQYTDEDGEPADVPIVKATGKPLVQPPLGLELAGCLDPSTLEYSTSCGAPDKWLFRPLRSLGTGAVLVPNPDSLTDPVGENRYVTLVENNHPQATGAVTLHVIRLGDERYRGAVSVITPVDPFDEKIELRHSGDFGGNTDEVYYEWWVRDVAPLEDLPTPDKDDDPLGWSKYDAGKGLNAITFEGDPEYTLGDKLFYVRYGHEHELFFGECYISSDPTPESQYDCGAFAAQNVEGGTVRDAAWRLVSLDTSAPDWSSPSSGDGDYSLAAAWQTPYQWAGALNSPQLQASGAKVYVPQLVMGWVKRVLDAVNPYEARFSADFTGDAPATYSSMLVEAGAPYDGPVALNADKDVIENVGLIALYSTVKDRALALTNNDTGAYPADSSFNQPLLLASTRLAMLHEMNANEAFSDAQNAALSVVSASGSIKDTLLAASPWVHAFQNEVADLGEETLALLRGTDYLKSFPVYNRLYPNYFKGLGEAAYNTNYNIKDANNDGLIDETDALILFPQGHGDAFGHYLSAIKEHYGLLRRDNFDWNASAELYALLGNVIPTDYLDEKSFARHATARARVGLSIVKETYRAAYTSDPDAQWQGYTDTSDPARAWGVSEWAGRSLQGAVFDWMVGNAMLPADPAVDDNGQPLEGLDRLDRETTRTELRALAGTAREIQQALNDANSAQTPLGLDADAVRFGLDPVFDGSGFVRKTHFEQVYESATAAAANAVQALNVVTETTQNLRAIANDTDALKEQAIRQDIDYKNRLIDLFGTPFRGAIGAGKLFKEGYSGPDLLTYMYLHSTAIHDFIPESADAYTTVRADIVADGVWGERDKGKSLSGGQDVQFQPVSYKQLEDHRDDIFNALFPYDEHAEDDPYDGVILENFETGPDDASVLTVKVPINTASDYAFEAPHEWEERASTGRIQVALADMLKAELELNDKLRRYETYNKKLRNAWTDFKYRLDAFAEAQESRRSAFATILASQEVIQASGVFEYNPEKNWTFRNTGSEADAAFIRGVGDRIEVPVANENNGDLIRELNQIKETLRKIGAADLNLTMSGGNAPGKARLLGFDISSAAREDGFKWFVNFKKGILFLAQEAKLQAELFGANDAKIYAEFNTFLSMLKGMSDMLVEEPVLRRDIGMAVHELEVASDRVRTLQAEGLRLIDERAAMNRQIAASAQRNRYNDMTSRLARDEALRKSDNAMDTALRFAFLAAKAYEYDTSLSDSHPANAGSILEAIQSELQLGLWDGGTPKLGNGGLADKLAQLKINYEALKGDIGLNNPQWEVSNFSLRSEAMRILPPGDGAADARWASYLASTVVDDLNSDPDFTRHCRPFADPAGPAQPGFKIRFSTEINSGRNFFGHSLSALDHGYSNANFSTRIRSVGVRFDGYDVAADGEQQLAVTPRVCLTPAGLDVMRYADGAVPKTRAWNVVNQRIPVPYPINITDLEQLAYNPRTDSLDGSFAELIRFGDFRAYPTADGAVTGIDPAYTDSQLFGRSVWNTLWYLFIPADYMSSDHETAITRFSETVDDINLELTTYSAAGM